MSATQGTEHSDSKANEKALQKENKALKGQAKQLEGKIRQIQTDLAKSIAVKDRLEGLCRELQKQNRFIKAESSAKIAEANEKGKELAQEVQNNMGFMKNIHENLATITAESGQVRKENEELGKKISTLKDHYEEREQILTSALNETNTALVACRGELTELKLKNAEEKEKLYGEMQQLGNALIASRDQMKEAKEVEIKLRGLLQNYDEKFNILQKSLKETNNSYEEFKKEMGKVSNRTKELELETNKWQARWEQSNIALSLMQENHVKLQSELEKAREGLSKMTNLCRALQLERKDLLSQLKKDDTENELTEPLKVDTTVEIETPTRSETSSVVESTVESKLTEVESTQDLVKDKQTDQEGAHSSGSTAETGNPEPVMKVETHETKSSTSDCPEVPPPNDMKETNTSEIPKSDKCEVQSVVLKNEDVHNDNGKLLSPTTPSQECECPVASSTPEGTKKKSKNKHKNKSKK